MYQKLIDFIIIHRFHKTGERFSRPNQFLKPPPTPWLRYTENNNVDVDLLEASKVPAAET
jgi:hypothetical protein